MNILEYMGLFWVPPNRSFKHHFWPVLVMFSHFWGVQGPHRPPIPLNSVLYSMRISGNVLCIVISMYQGLCYGNKITVHPQTNLNEFGIKFKFFVEWPRYKHQK
jgi:hypothetical protein